MPAVNPRITITLTPEVHSILKRLSELTGNSQSSLVGELLQTSKPVFERMAKVLEAAARLKAEGLSGSDQIRESLELAQGRLEDQLELVMEQVGGELTPLLGEAEHIPRRSGRKGPSQAKLAAAAAAAPEFTTPVPVTRGSGTPPKRSASGKSRTERGVRSGAL